MAIQKGNIPWNKGIKTGIVTAGAFKKGHRSGFRRKEITWQIDEDCCWNCTSHAPDTRGYPQKKVNGKKQQISRIIYAEKFGAILDGLHVLHECDNRMCINPEHLFLGTNADNVADKVSKGRQSRLPGERHPMVKLTEQQVREIRANQEMGCRKLAGIYGVHYSTIAYIRKGKLWKHVV